MAKDVSDSRKPDHAPGTRKGEEIRHRDGKETGRHDQGHTGAGRPSGTSTARDSTAVNPDAGDPVDPKSPKLPPA